MSNPTQFYAWTQPSPNQDPFDVTFDAMVSAQDTTIRSVELLAPNRLSVVISHYPTTTTCIGFTTALAFTVMSQAPFGRLVSSFSLVRSGAQVLLDLKGYAYLQTGVISLQNNTELFFRAVIQPGSISVPSNKANTVLDSGWLVSPFGTMVHVPLGFTAVTSLGPGNFSIELQAGGIATTGGSVFAMNTNDWLVLTAREGDLIT